MKRKPTILLCILSMSLSQVCAQTLLSVDSLATDTTSYKIVNDSISSQQDPNSSDSVNRGPINPVVGDDIILPIIVGSQSQDFSYTNARNTKTFNSYYFGTDAKDVFYKFTLAVPMNVTMTHQGSAVADTYMYLLDSNGALITSNDNYDGEDHCTDTCHSFIRRQLAAGTYYVVSEGKISNGLIRTNITGNVASSFNYPSIPSTYNTDPGTAVGGMGGQFSVSPMGGATYSIPIDVPQGVGGLQPQLSIVYNSQSGNGLCGYSTSLAGISSITRGPKDIYHDGNAIGMNYLADDALYLDGVRLLLISGTAGQDSAVYCPESDPFTRVIARGSCSSISNDTWYEVHDGNGIVSWYGCNNSSCQSYNDKQGTQKIYAWYINRVIQQNNNYIEYYYDILDSCVYLVLIGYGSKISVQNHLSNQIQLSYETSNGIPIHFDDQHALLNKRLKTITCISNDGVYRSYTLNYDNTTDSTLYKYSRLTSVVEKNGNNEALPATLFNWSYLPPLSYHSTSLSVANPTSPSSVSLPFGNQMFVSGDLNNDGLDDIAGLSFEVTVNGQVRSYLSIYWAEISNTNVAYSERTVFEMPSVFYNSLFEKGSLCDFHSYLNGSAIVDWDGDGYNEVMLPYYQEMSGDNTLRFYIQGCDSTGQSCWNESVTCPLNTGDGSLYSIADLDNDGRSDITVLEKSLSNNYYTCRILSFDSGLPVNYRTVTLQLSLPSTPGQVYLSDMNGNGLKDLFVICANGYAIYWNQGGGLTSSTFSDSKKSTGSSVMNARSLNPGDFNGDGLMDMLSNSGSSDWYVFYNNGDGTFSQTWVFSNSTLADQGFTDRDDNLIFCNVVDFDADGKSDVIITKAEYERKQDEIMHIPIGEPWGEFKTVHTFWMCATSGSWSEEYHASSVRYEDIRSSKYITGDFDGDGRIELVNYGYDCVNGTDSNSDPVWRIFKNSGLTAQTGKVTSITGDYGATTSITYSTLTDDSVYTRGMSESYPSPRYTIPLNVVKQTIQSNGAAGDLTTRYFYEGLKSHLKGRGLLGFSKTTANSITTGVRTESGITRWDTVHYIPKITYSKTTIGGSTARTVNTLTIADSYLNSRKLYFAYPSQSVSTDFDGYVMSTYRAFNTEKGYITSDSTVYAPGMYRSINYLDYTQQKVGGAYRPQLIVSSQKHSNDPSPFSVATSYTYNSTTGTVASKVDNYGSSKALTTQYTYDMWGNLTSQVITGSGITTPCTTYYSYESTNRFPERIYTSPSSSVQKYTYDIWGNVLTERDSINSSINDTITHTYDDWGRRIRTKVPGSGEITYLYGWSSDAFQRWYVLEQGTARPWVKTWYDNRGREVKTESRGPKNVTVSSITSYDSNGQIANRTDRNGNLTLSYSYLYDSRGRMTQETSPGNHIVNYQYGNNRSVTVTENNNSTTRTYDAWGNIKGISAPLSSYITNTYASNGSIMTTESGGATWQFTYDDCGNRISMADPDAGTTTYIYDALGREISRTDGRGVVFATNYDYLGRVVSRSAGYDVTYYTYGNSGTGQLRLVSESNDNWTYHYSYDSHGRLSGETLEMNSTEMSWTKTYQYNTAGLMSGRGYPGNRSLSYTYDSYGNCTNIRTDNNQMEWELTGYTGSTTTSSLKAADTYPYIRTTQIDSNGRLQSRSTTRHNITLQNDSYTFAAQTGNLVSRTVNGVAQSFGYDNIDRLTNVTTGQNQVSVTYSANGNITSKSDMGQYSYNASARPHAVTSVDMGGSIPDRDQWLYYNDWGKISELSYIEGNDAYYYYTEYGPDQEKVMSYLGKNNDWMCYKIHWGDYEEYHVGDSTTVYYWLKAPDGLAGLFTYYSYDFYQSSHYYAATTDHLGSLTGLYENGGVKTHEASYDAWGIRTLGQTNMPLVTRGFTGHEHLDGLRLIDMKGRLYDPELGRFLSPDNYIQSPYDPQNYNRYSYCLNNPLRFTDPSGNNFVETLLTGIVDFFTTAFFKGGLDLSNFGSMREAWRNYDPTAPWSKTNKSWKMSIGFYTLDTNKSSWEQAWQLFSRFTWESPQSFLGGTVNQIHNLFGGVKNVGYCCGATVVESYADGWGAFTIGNYINGNRGIQANSKNTLFQHEFGHYLQSQKWGPIYLTKCAIPSLIDCALPAKHQYHPVEQDANILSFKYFRDNESDFIRINEEGELELKWSFNNNPILGFPSNHSTLDAIYNHESLDWRLSFSFVDIIDIPSLGLINSTYMSYYQMLRYWLFGE